jgi:hypothetical protein
VLTQALFHYGQDTAMHRFNARVALDGDNTRWLTLRNGTILVVDAAEECGIQQLETIFVFPGDGDGGLVAMARAGERGVEVRKQQ